MVGSVARLVLDRPRTMVRLLFILMGIAALVFALWGFSTAGAGDPVSWDRALLLALQLFVMNVDSNDITSCQTRIASLLAPAATAGTVALAFHASIVRRWRYLVLLFRPADEAFLGGGDMAGAILEQQRDDRSRRRRLIGLDIAPEQRLHRAMRSGGWKGHVFVGDALTETCLHDLNVADARKVWVMTGDDLRNLEIVRRLLDLRAARKNAVLQDIAVHLRDPGLGRARQTLSGVATSGTHVEYFNLPRLAARRMLMDHPPRYPRAGSKRPLHLCAVGDSEITRALLAHAAMHCVHAEEPELAVRLTLVARDARAVVERLHRRYPALATADPGDGALVRLLPLATIEALDADPAHVSLPQWEALQLEQPFDSIYVAAEHDLSTFAAARRVLALRDASAARRSAPIAPVGPAQVVACINDHRPYPSGDAGAWPAAVKRFDVFSECFARDEPYPGAHSDEMARIIHSFYSDSAPGGSAPRPWADQPDAFRWSSRLCGDHIEVKLAVLGLSAWTAAMADIEAAVADNLELLMRLEHRRFVAERLLEGWLPLAERHAVRDEPAPSGLGYGEQKTLLNLSVALLPFDELDEVEQKKDLRLIQALPECIEKAMETARPEAGDELRRAAIGERREPATKLAS
jgi:hypothetical protein